MKITLHPCRIFLVVLALIVTVPILAQSKNKFVIILDAGHGGKDPGNSYHGFVEKEIALKTSLKLEQFLKKHKDIQIVYTRESDVFIPLKDRPRKANSLHANLFVSVHCNSVTNPEPYGTETFVMGLSRSKGNLEIAKQENSVILLEKDYKSAYKGFDPKNPLGMVGLQMLQEDYMNRSIALASKIQNNFVKQLNRKSRGIKQTPLWVLDAVFMPSVLIELGFLSNKNEGLYLNSDAGQSQMAEAIATAIVDYKREYFDDRSTSVTNDDNKSADKEVTKNERNGKGTPSSKSTNENDKVSFLVQFAAGTRELKLVPSNFKGLKDVSVVATSAKLFNYRYGNTSSYEIAKQNLKVVQDKGYTSAYIIAVKNGQTISLKEALK